MYKEQKTCLVCKTETLSQVIDMGEQYVVDFVKEKDEKLLKVPLVLMYCDKCGLVQLKHHVSPDRLYKKFWYRSGINAQMRDELLAIVTKAKSSVSLTSGDKVLDIGCNDGTLLGWYHKGVTTIGIDPCSDLVKEGMNENRIDIGIDDYFSADRIELAFKSLGMPVVPKFKVITAIAMFYDIADPLQFLKDCKRLLHPEGVLVIQMNYLHTMLLDTAFDNICHEHLSYWSLYSLKHAIELAGLDLQGAELSKSNGGAIRAYITHPTFQHFYPSDYQNKLWLYSSSQLRMKEEMKFGLQGKNVYDEFAMNVQIKMSKLREFIDDLVSQGKKVYGYGASTRGTVLLQYLYKDVECPLLGIAERDEHKYGLKMVGTWTPIMPEQTVRDQANYMLVLPWHFRDSILEREKDWIKHRGSLIFPLPIPSLAQPIEEELIATETKKI